MKCISCNYEHNEKYCPNCGEKNGIKKITFVSILEDTFSSITNMDKGFLFNIKTLILKPKTLTTDYIRGKRKGILNPISFLILSVTLYLIVITLLKTSIEPNEIIDIKNSKIYNAFYQAGIFIRAYIKFFWILTIIPLALSLKLIFKNFNYIEHLAISSFVIGQATLVGIISFIVLKAPLIFDPVVYLTIFWLIFKIFNNKKSKIESFFISLTGLIVFIILLAIIIGIIGFFNA